MNWQTELGIVQGNRYKDAKRKYLRLARKAHPNKGGTTVGFQRLQQAWTEALMHYKPNAISPGAAPPPPPQGHHDYNPVPRYEAPRKPYCNHYHNWGCNDEVPPVAPRFVPKRHPDNEEIIKRLCGSSTSTDITVVADVLELGTGKSYEGKVYVAEAFTPDGVYAMIKQLKKTHIVLAYLGLTNKAIISDLRHQPDRFLHAQPELHAAGQRLFDEIHRFAKKSHMNVQSDPRYTALLELIQRGRFVSPEVSAAITAFEAVRHDLLRCMQTSALRIANAHRFGHSTAEAATQERILSTRIAEIVKIICDPKEWGTAKLHPPSGSALGR
jgi:hypothetical protein